MTIIAEDNPVLEECIRKFIFQYRTNGLQKNEMIRRRRSCIEWFASLHYRRVYDLREDQISEILSKCDESYFADCTDAYDDPLYSILRDNAHVTVSNFLISLIRNKSLSMSVYEQDIKGMSGGMKTEIVSMINPDSFVAYDYFTRAAAEYLKLPSYSETFIRYMRFLDLSKELAVKLQNAGILRADLRTVSEFLLFVFTIRDGN